MRRARMIPVRGEARGFTVESLYLALWELMDAGLGSQPVRVNVRPFRQTKQGALVRTVGAASDDNETEVA